jgi:hypothetical protein
MSLTYDEDMKIEVYKGEIQEGIDITEQELFATYLINGIGNLKDNHIGKKEGSSKPKVSLSFEMTRSGLLQLNKAEAKMDELVVYNETVKKEKPVVEEEEKPAQEEGDKS